MSKNEDIIVVARALFSKYGFKRVSMDEIAKKANVTKKTIYHYFKDKRELFCYFINDELEKIKEKIEINESEEDSCIEKISDNLNLVLSFSEKSDLLNALIKERKENTALEDDFFKVYEDKIIAYIEEKIDEEISNNHIKSCDSHLTAFAIYKMIFSLTFEYDREIDKKKISSEIREILTNGLLIKGGNKDEK